jgi:hemoglobin
MYAAFGGREGCHRLSEAFYARVKQDPLLRPLFPGKTMRCAIDEFAAFMVQHLGGPGEDSQKRWWVSLRDSHSRFTIRPDQREAWLTHMRAAVEEVGVAEPFRSELLAFFAHTSVHWQPPVDEAVAAIRAGDAARAAELMEGAGGPSVQCGLVALCLRCGLGELARARLAADPSLARERYAGRTLLHEAAAAGDLESVELLMGLGVDVDVPDRGGHTPLYGAANEGGSVAVVQALVRAGADVNACGGVKRCTPLHMAARRGFVAIAEALLACGADIGARDSLGVTPLGRALNCRKSEIAAFLRTRGGR